MNKKIERGCGERAENALYLCVDLSPTGRPIEDFLVDPVVSWSGGQLRAPMLVESKGVTHIVLGIGATYYPFVSDFVEETRRFGISKRVPRNFQVERLTAGKSKLLLAHPRSIPNFDHEARASSICPKRNNEEHECIGFLWPLSSLKEFEKVHTLGKGAFGTIMVKTPSCWYEVRKPHKPKEFIDHYSSGIILAFPVFHFEYVNRQGRVPSKMKKRIEKANFRLDVTAR